MKKAPRSRKHEIALSLRRRACIALELEEDFDPPTNLASILKEAGLKHSVWTYIRHADSEDCRKLVATYVKLAPGERDAVSIDHYLAATHADFHKVFGALSEQVSRIEGGKAAMMISASAPRMAKAASNFGDFLHGHADRKMILQTAGVAPVPKNQVTNVTFRDSVIDARRQTAISVGHVPTLDEVVRDVDSVVYEERDARDIPEGANLEPELLTSGDE